MSEVVSVMGADGAWVVDGVVMVVVVVVKEGTYTILRILHVHTSCCHVDSTYSTLFCR